MFRTKNLENGAGSAGCFLAPSAVFRDRQSQLQRRSPNRRPAGSRSVLIDRQPSADISKGHGKAQDGKKRTSYTQGCLYC